MSMLIRINGAEENMAVATIAELLRVRGIDGARGVAVAVNGAVVPSRRWPQTPITSGDEIEIVRPFGGG